MTKFIDAPMGEGKADLISRVANRSDLTAFEQEFVEHHALVSEAYAVARKINRSEYVNQRMYASKLLLQRPRRKQ